MADDDRRVRGVKIFKSGVLGEYGEGSGVNHNKDMVNRME